jgi:hypothetical protein
MWLRTGVALCCLLAVATSPVPDEGPGTCVESDPESVSTLDLDARRHRFVVGLRGYFNVSLHEDLMFGDGAVAAAVGPTPCLQWGVLPHGHPWPVDLPSDFSVVQVRRHDKTRRVRVKEDGGGVGGASCNR